MKLPVNVVKQFTDIEYDIERLVSEISGRICNIESTTNISEEYEGIIVGQITEKREHPNADKLSVYKVNIGAEEPVQVVAGDKTLEVGEKVAYFKPGSSIPYQDGDEYIIKETKLRGEISQGMMASEKELSLGTDHSRVMRLDLDASVGQPFSEYFGLDDIVIDIENKGLTNRGDLFGILGLAREISALQGKPFKSPDWFTNTNIEKPQKKCLRLEIQNDTESTCPRYTAIAIDNINIKESPVWMKAVLIKTGLRPINNIVDITNYLMVLTGQPLHAFDYDKVVKRDTGEEDEAHIVVRMAKNGEKIHVINGDVINLTERNMVIADSTNPIGIAGVMGGMDTEVDENTTRIIIESANFDRFNIRKTSMEHGLNTDASDRFKRAQDPNMCLPVLLEAVHLVRDLAGGEVAGDVIDIYPNPVKPLKISFDIKRLNTLLGINLDYDQIKEILQNLEYIVSDLKDNTYITVDVPTFRRDVSIAEDIYEDIGRIYGYDKITPILPKIEIVPPKTPLILEAKKTISNILSNSGSNETSTYNFISSKILTDTGQNPNIAYHIKNAVSPELEYMRPSLIPSLIEKLQLNLNKGHNEVSLFENNISHQKDVLDNDGLPLENWYLSWIYGNKDRERYDGSPYYMSKRYLEKVLYGLGIQNIEYVLCMDFNLENSSVWLKNISNTFELNSSAVILSDKNVLGIAGELSGSVKEKFKLPEYTSGFEIDITKVVSLQKESVEYKREPSFPAITRDICFTVDDSVKYSDLENELKKILNTDDMYSSIRCLDIYKEREDSNLRKITFTISIQNYKKTLTEKDFEKIKEKIASVLKKKIKVTLED